MGTPALIAHDIGDELVCIMVNYDGHEDSVGKALRDVFNTDEKVQELMALGNCSSLSCAKDISEVVAYHRDKGETMRDNESMNFDTLYDAQGYYSPIYSYVWDGEKWTGYHGDEELGASHTW